MLRAFLIDVEIEKHTKVVEESTKTRDNAEAVLREAEAQQASATEAQVSVKLAIEKRMEESMNRETNMMQADVHIETTEMAAMDFKSVVERSAAAEKAAGIAADAAEVPVALLGLSELRQGAVDVLLHVLQQGAEGVARLGMPLRPRLGQHGRRLLHLLPSAWAPAV